MRRILAVVSVTLAVLLPALTAMAADGGSRAPIADNPLDRDGDGRLGEAAAIQARIRNYLERHGDNDVVTPEAMAAKTAWAYDRYLAKQRDLGKGIQGSGWVSLGPNNGAGRCTAVAPHPTEPDTVLAGAAGGGVWKSTDSGLTWRSLTDGLVSDLSVGALAYAPSDPNVLYLGTGEGGYAIDFIPGIGLVRSEDGGETWILPAYAVASMFFSISVDPRDAESFLAGTNAGLFASTDGGVSWSFPLTPNGVRGVTDVVRSASNPDLVYAALWCAGQCPSGYDRVMRSTDNGQTWSAAGSGLPATNANDFTLNRNSLTASAANDQILYLGLNVAGTGPPARVYRSSDGGGSWTYLAQTSAYLGSQGWYDNTITSGPTDPNVVVGGGVYYIVSSNGGTSWTEKNPYQGAANVPHVDAHDLRWQGSTLWVACDGGIWKSTDNGYTWADCNAGLITRQYYALTVDPVHRERVIAGSQDNGTDRRRDAGDDSWDQILGGDGFECAINPLLPDIAYATIYNTYIARSANGGAGGWVDVSPGYGSDATPFITPLTMRPETPWVIYTGSTRVFRSEDTGDSWLPLSTQVENGSWSGGQGTEVWAVAVTPADPDVVMVAKNTNLYRSSDGGQTWRLATQGTNGLPNKRVINAEISPFDADIALACLAGTNVGHLYRTEDGGETWQQSDSGLPPFSVQVARWDPTDPSVVYAGTDVGVWRSTDGGLTWSEFGDGLPAASVHDIRILPDGSMLRIATHGRGAWGLTIPRPANTPPTITITSPTVDQVVNLGDGLDFAATAIDADGDALTVRWVTSDTWAGTVATGVGQVNTTFHSTFAIGGTWTVTAQADDGHGGVANANRSVIVTDPADDCHTPRVIAGDGPFPVEIRTSNLTAARATTDPSVPCAATAQDPNAGAQASLWFELTPAVSARYALSTCGSMPDPVLSVWTGDVCGPYTAIEGGCNDDDELLHCRSRRTDSYLELDLTAGQTYRILVGSWRTDLKGTIRLNVDCLDCPAPPEHSEYMIPAAAHNPGLNDTYWVTDLDLHNPGATSLEAELSFLPPDADNSSATQVPADVPAHGSLALHDVVATLFAAQGSGAIRVLAPGELIIASRTYNTATEGTYGQFIPGVPTDQAIPPNGAALLIGLEQSGDFRTNVGVANTSATTATAAIELHAADGQLLSTRDVSLLPYGWLQISDIFTAQGYPQVDDGFAFVRNTSATASFVAYASVVDQHTGDPVAITATDQASPGTPVWIAAAAHSAGVGGTVWRTDVELVNSSATDLEATVDLLRADRDNSQPLTTQVVLGPLQAVRLEDLLDTAYGVLGSGALRVSVSSGELTVTSRTFNLTPTGTYGQFIPGVTSARAVGSGASGHLVGLRRNTGFRTNVGVVNLTGSAITVQASYYAADGSALGSATYELAPYAYHQANGAIPGQGDVDGGFAVLSSSSPGALFLAYASVVDNGSGDPVFIPAAIVN